jgi:hypothetical protein
LKDWRGQNQEEAKKLAILIQQVDKSTRWKGLRTIFSPSTSYQIFKPLKKETTILTSFKPLLKKI